MLVVNDPYVEARDGNVYIGKTRVTLDTVVLYWKQGKTAEYIHQHFPTVPLASVYGTIAYYLSHQEEVDADLTELQAKADRLYAEMERTRPQSYVEMRARLVAIRERMQQESSTENETDTSLPTGNQSV